MMSLTGADLAPNLIKTTYNKNSIIMFSVSL